MLYHDWTVTETGLDIPVSSITVDQFRRLSGSKSRPHTNSTPPSPKFEHPPLPPLTPPPTQDAALLSKPEMPRRTSHQSGSETSSVSSKDGNQPRLGRSNSLGAMAKLKSLSASEPADPAAKMKGNGLGTIQAPFATLKDTFEVSYHATYQLPLYLYFSFLTTTCASFLDCSHKNRLQYRGQIPNAGRGRGRQHSLVLV